MTPHSVVIGDLFDCWRSGVNSHLQCDNRSLASDRYTRIISTLDITIIKPSKLQRL
jgi:hypothetical protein